MLNNNMYNAVKFGNYIEEKLGNGVLISSDDYEHGMVNLEWRYKDATNQTYFFKKRYSLEFLIELINPIVLADDFVKSCKEDPTYRAVYPVSEE